jgi:hypothetical protein
MWITSLTPDADGPEPDSQIRPIEAGGTAQSILDLLSLSLYQVPSEFVAQFKTIFLGHRAGLFMVTENLLDHGIPSKCIIEAHRSATVHHEDMADTVVSQMGTM